MVDRRMSALIATLAVFLVCAVLWDAFVPSGSRRPRPAAAPQAVAPPDTTAHAASAPALDPATGAAPAPPPPAAPPASHISSFDMLARAESRRRIRASAGYTYLDQVVAESQDSALHRWNDRVDRPVRVYLPAGTVANFQPAFLDAVRSAFERWEDAGVPVRFNIVSDSEQPEVVFRWKVQFDIERTGQTDLTWESDGQIVGGQVTIATFDPKGQPLSPDDVKVVATHEIGHLLGLDHSSDSNDIMFANTRVRDLSARDIRTALLLYQLAPGPLSTTGP